MAVSSVDIALFLHVTSVVVGFGATFAEALAVPVAMRLSARHLPYVHRLQLAINQWLATPALALVLITGLFMVDRLKLSMGDAWLGATFAILVVLGGLLGAYFIPTDRKLGELVEAEIAAAGDGEVRLSEQYLRRSRVEGLVGTLTGLLIVVAIFLMVVKP
jgi:uncharacterized membrane protein